MITPYSPIVLGGSLFSENAKSKHGKHTPKLQDAMEKADIADAPTTTSQKSGKVYDARSSYYPLVN